MDAERKPLRMRFETLPPKRTAQQKGAFVRNGRIMFYTKKEVRREEQTLTALVLSRLPAGWEPFRGPVDLTVRLCYPYRKGEPKRVQASGLEIPHDCRPDLDNLLKGLFDALTAAQVWGDDSQIARLDASKSWGPKAYWEVVAAPARREGGTPASAFPAASQGTLWGAADVGDGCAERSEKR